MKPFQIDPLVIGSRKVGPGHPAYLVAEMSCNHGQSLERALEIIHAAKESGADAVKVQTYTADSMTIDSNRPEFQLTGTQWAGKNLHRLYSEVAMPWDWHKILQQEALRLGMDFFSTPFDPGAVEFLDSLEVPVFKIASFEMVDDALLKAVAQTGKPVIVSTGMADLQEITRAADILRTAGCRQFALLKCTMAWPAEAAEMNLQTIPDLAERFLVPTGLSDHSLELAVPIAAVSLGACIIEKHFTLRRSDGGADASFSLEPSEFLAMTRAVRTAEAALGQIHYGPVESENRSREFRRSLFVVKNMGIGEAFTEENLRSIRPGYGLPPSLLPSLLGRKSARAIEAGTPLQQELIATS